MLRDALPPGFRQSSAATGLLVPEDTPRQREVWTRSESKLHDRHIDLLKSRGIAFLLRCDDPTCKGQTMTREKNDAGELILRCDHKDRVMTRAF